MKKIGFFKALTVFTAIMLVLGTAVVIYIYSLLVQYEASQPERAVEDVIDRLGKAALNGTVEEMLSFEAYRPESDEQREKDISAYISKLKGELRYEEVTGVSSGVVYNIKNGKEILASVTLESVATETRLIVFNFETWEVKSVAPAVIDKELKLPASVGLTVNGEQLTGMIDPETGNVIYSFCSLTTPEIILSDVSGNKAVFDAAKNITTYAYTVSVPSNYTVYADGNAVDPAVAVSGNISEYAYVSEYCDAMPTQLTYALHFLTNIVEFKITDNLGENVEFEMKNRSVTIEGQAGADAVPEDIAAQINVLEVARQWSLFMTDDLAGTNHGYSEINRYLIDDSELQSVAWAWATGPDINFTSVHSLAADPFVNESVTDYVRYSEDCFSCSISFQKHMIIAGGKTEMDEIDSTFYFVNTAEDGADPVWLIADIRENITAEVK